MEDRFGHCISYLRVSITDRCNERCRYCMPAEVQEWLPRDGILSYEETLRLVRIGAGLGIRKIRVTGGEPLTRRDVTWFIGELCGIEGIEEVGVSTNGTLLASPDPRAPGRSIAESLAAAGVRSVNVSLDSLDRGAYARATGRDFLGRALDGIEAAKAAGIPSLKLNCVLMRGFNEDQLLPLLDYAHERGALLRFIELMPVSTTEVLTEENFLPVGEAKRCLEEALGGRLEPRPDFRTNGPSSYFAVPGRGQLVGFIGAMTNLHFCESCNKLRLTCDGRLRPCLGSFLEFDILSPLRAGATDAELAAFFRSVVDRKPKEHEFRENYQPNRHMTAIGG